MRINSVIPLFTSMVMSCHSAKENTHSINLEQGIKGVVREEVGNQMPSPDVKPPEPKPLKTTVYVYELTNMSQVINEKRNAPFYTSILTKEVAKVDSDAEGKFVLSLPAGRYSLFTKVDGRFYAGNFDEKMNIQPVTVEENKVTETKITIRAKAYY